MKFIEASWPAPQGIKAGTTTRDGWKTDTLSTKSATSRQMLRHALPTLPAEPVWLNQTHGITALPATPSNTDKEGDASFSTRANDVCIILTADCLPILICDKQGTTVAAIHAGWRGLANGIIESSLRSLAVSPDQLLVWLGPAIGPDKFEVGPDVFDAFTSIDKASTAAFKPAGTKKWLADLYHLATIQLNTHGVIAIYGGNYCTYSQSELFYSYRRDKGQTGRMASVIWREE